MLRTKPRPKPEVAVLPGLVPTVVHLTPGDLVTGVPRDVYAGPLALAVGRAMGLAPGQVGVAGGRVFWNPTPGRFSKVWHRAWLPKPASLAEAAFDRGEPVDLLEFEIERNPEL